MNSKFLGSKILIGLFGSGIVAFSANAFDYDFHGGAYAFSKIGFNNNDNISEGKYPTDSWASIGLEANVEGSFVEGFTYGLGGMVSAPIWDKTWNGQKPSLAYINGTSRHSVNNGLDEDVNSYYAIQMAYLGYQYKNNGLDIGIKGGRYADHGLDWFSGYSEGAHIWAGSDSVKLQVNFINRRGLAENGWFYDFYTIGKNDTFNAPRYFITAQLDMNFGDFGLKPQVWYHRNDYIAPGLSAFYQYNGEDFSAKTGLYSLFVLSQKGGVDSVYLNGTNKRLGTILIIQEDMAYKNVDFGAGLWKNFGNPDGNSGIGRHGNLAKIDVWTSSGYDYTPDGWALTDVNSEDAFTFWLYGGQRLGDFKYELIGRVTTSRASNEQSIALNLSYDVTEAMTIGAKLEWFNDVSKNDLSSLSGYSGNKSSVTNDRSHIYLTAAYKF